MLQEFEDGRASKFQHGAIYWWPDTGTIAINDVIVHYTGWYCFGETDTGEFVVAAARSLADEAIVKGTPLLAKAALAVPYFGPILWPGIEIAVPLIKKDLLDLVGEFFACRVWPDSLAF